jgi:hypothetical protein
MIMKSTFKKLLLGMTVVGGSLALNGLNAQQIYWGGPGDANATFDGGFNDWTPVGISCANKPNGTPVDASNAVWTWSTSPRSQGAYVPAAFTGFQSPTAANGAAMFDSDFLDNGGVAGAFGAGDCPASHRAELISPVIDLSGITGVALEFYQFHRRFAGPGGDQSVPPTYVEVSGDGGQTWSSITLNQGISVNSATANPVLAFVNVSQWADNNPEFQFKFVFNGDYYFWIVDDVSLISVPEVNIRRGRYGFTGKSLVQPKDVMDQNEFIFGYEVINDGGNVDVLVSVDVRNEATNESVHSDASIITVPSGTTRGLNFDAWVPQGLAPGDYRIFYTIEDTEGRPDFNPNDNNFSFPFRVSEDLMVSGNTTGAPVLLAGIGPTGWGYGAAFFSPRDPNVQFSLTEVSSRFQGWSGASLDGKLVTLYLIELGPDFYNSQPSLLTAPANELTLRGIGEISLAQSQSNQVISIPLESFDPDASPDDPIVLTPGGDFMAIAIMPDDVAIGSIRDYPSWAMNFDEDGAPVTGFVQIDKSRIYNNDAFSANFNGIAPHYQIQFNISTVSNAPRLDESTFKIFPNPATEYFQVELDFNKEMTTNIYLADINGRMLKNFVVTGAKMLHTVNTSDLAPGTYILLVSNEEGVASKKVMVVK